MAASTSTIGAKTGTFLGRRVILGILALTGITVVTVILLFFNYYWLALIFFFASLFLTTRMSLEEYQFRNLVLLLIASTFVTFLVGTLANDYWAANPEATPLGQVDAQTIIFMSIFAGIMTTIVLVVIPFLLLIAIAAVGLLRWHQSGSDISYLEAFKHLLFDVLGTYRMWVVAEGGKLKGDERDIKHMDEFGGPGWLTVGSGNVVVLHQWGKITRVVGLGSTPLQRWEKVKAVLPLGGQGNVNTIENVLTKDRVPLTIKVLHAAQMEPAAETAARLPNEIQSGTTFGDEYDQCYDFIAKRVAAKAPNIWDSLKGSVANNLKDVIMSYNFDELFNLSGTNANPADNRQIAEIERTVFQRAHGSGLNNGVILRVVDINEILFPEEIKNKLSQQIAAHVDARIAQTEALTKELTAASEANAAQHQAAARITLAQAEFQTEQFRAQARAQHYQQIIQVLQNQGQPPATISAVVERLASSATTQDEYNRLLEMMTHYIRGEHTGNAKH